MSACALTAFLFSHIFERIKYHSSKNYLKSIIKNLVSTANLYILIDFSELLAVNFGKITKFEMANFWENKLIKYLGKGEIEIKRE